MDEKVRISLLLDYYGRTLTKKQLQYMHLYYNEDFSLSEIADGEKVSRQAVLDSIKRGKRQLIELEDELMLLTRREKYLGELKRLYELIGKIEPVEGSRVEYDEALNGIRGVIEAWEDGNGI